ncbi:MAG: hypothetical protein IJU56_08645, partial [Clostridia bacterium]|nr:hypothetical protein [Clostridia bacterium]
MLFRFPREGKGNLLDGRQFERETCFFTFSAHRRRRQNQFGIRNAQFGIEVAVFSGQCFFAFSAKGKGTCLTGDNLKGNRAFSLFQRIAAGGKINSEFGMRNTELRSRFFPANNFSLPQRM